MTWPASDVRPRARVISDNDYSGDPDGLVQLAHHVLSPSVEVRTVIGTPPAPYDPLTAAGRGADASVEQAAEVLRLAGRSDIAVVAGSNHSMTDRTTPQPSAGVDAVVAEALRDDADLRLFVCCGGSLTTVASAWLTEPAIAERCTVVWIGGSDGEPPEYNQSIDPVAAQVVLEDSGMPVWQVPREAYRQVLASQAELEQRLVGPLGHHLLTALGEVATTWGLGETFVLGDNPLVLLTALLSSFEPDTSSCEWEERGRRRVYTRLDTRLLLDDLYAKLARHAG